MPYKIGTQALAWCDPQLQESTTIIPLHRMYKYLTPPLSRNSVGKDVEAAPEVMKDRRRQSLGEEIGKLRRRGDMEDPDFAKCHAISDEV